MDKNQKMKTPQGDRVAVTLVMNDYQAINLRWLLRTISDAKYSKEFFESRYGKGKLPSSVRVLGMTRCF